MFKYRGKEDWAEPMGQMMAECLQETGWRAQGITFVPLHPDRLAERGFNQAERLATVLAAWSKLPLYPVLERITPTTPQSRSNRHQRLVAMRGVFGVSPTFREPLPASLIVVDDVYTTGATLVDCARALAQAGVSRIRSVTFAR
jgi:competence protein ComFC